MADIQSVLFDKRFLEVYAGPHILNEPRTAIIELIANSWDAGATRVDVCWPTKTNKETFEIKDNGHGMTKEEFMQRWRTLSYNRLEKQGPTVNICSHKKLPARQVFGRNGVGRFAAFCFADEYSVETWRDGIANTFHIARGSKDPLEITLENTSPKTKNGTRIYVSQQASIGPSEEDIRAEIGLRFLTDPNFKVYVNSEEVAFSDINQGQVKEYVLECGDIGTAKLIVIDTRRTDRTTQHHGIAWHVKTRLVGNCTWRNSDNETLADGRRIAAKRYTFIVQADFLSEAKAVNKDWTGFNKENDAYQAVAGKAYDVIDKFLFEASEEDRKKTFQEVHKENRETLRRLSLREVNM